MAFLCQWPIAVALYDGCVIIFLGSSPCLDEMTLLLDGLTQLTRTLYLHKSSSSDRPKIAICIRVNPMP